MRPAKKRILRVLFLIAVRITKSKLEITLRTYAPGKNRGACGRYQIAFLKKERTLIFMLTKKEQLLFFYL